MRSSAYPLALICMVLVASRCAADDLYVPPAGLFASFNFGVDWRFAKGSFPFDTVDDTAWDHVSAPHNYNDLVGFQGFSNPKIDLGPHTYRKHFRLPAQFANRQVFLEFQGIRNRGHFILNGHELGRHENGVTPIGFDITHLVAFGDGDNVIQLEVDCGTVESSTNANQAWLGPALNPVSSGIVRNVFLHIANKVHLTLPLYTFLKTSGIYAYAQNISTEKRTAEIGVDAEVRNDSDAAATVRCASHLLDRAGRQIALLDAGTQQVAAGAQISFNAKAAVSDLNFWQPTYPYLYRISTVIAINGKPVDVREITTGFRKVEIRGSALYLNNRLLMTMGYSPRSTNEWPGLGCAYPDWLHQYSDQMMVDGHATMVRWEHVMPSPQDTTACDRIGLTQMFPAADRENDMMGREWDIRSAIMRDSMIYNRNSPSIILWENGNGDINKFHCDELYALRGKWDPYGMRPMGGRGESPEFTSWMFGVHKQEHRLSIDAEYMRDESPRRWWDQWSPPYFHSKGEVNRTGDSGGWNWNQDNMCVQQAKEYDRYYQARPGTAPMCCNGGMKIFLADSDSFSRGVDTFRRSGAVDGMRVEKDAYRCQTVLWANTPELWSDGKPAIFLPGHWNYPKGTIKPVYVFTSIGIDKVALLVNGKPVSAGKRMNPFYYAFEQVSFEPGEITAIGYDATGMELARSSHATVGKAAKIRLAVIQGPGGLRADGEDVALIQTEVTDSEGRRCPDSFDAITYAVTGPASWKGGLWEEDVGKYMGKTELPVICGVHRVSLRSTLAVGVITVTAACAGLESATVEIPSHPISLVGGLSPELPTISFPALPSATSYGPDLAPATRPPAGFFDAIDYDRPLDKAEREGNRALGRARSIFARWRPTIVPAAKDGMKIYADKPWTFEKLPQSLIGSDFIQVVNGGGIAAAEGYVFTIFKPALVYIAYDELNQSLPMNNSGTEFIPTGEVISINGHRHRIYRSPPQKALDQLYLGTNSWPGKPPENANNYIVFVKALDEAPDARTRTDVGK